MRSAGEVGSIRYNLHTDDAAVLKLADKHVSEACG